MDLLVLLAVVVFLGAIFGGESFGGVIRKGCGIVIVGLAVLAAIGLLAVVFLGKD